MKKLVKVLSIVLCAVLAVGCFTACSQNKNNSGKTTTAQKSYKIGIIQYMSHPSLDNCYKGIIKGLDASEVKYTVDYQTGSSNSAAADCSTFAQKMVAEGCDMIIAIATPAATAAYAAVNGTKIPLVFCAVSDPVAAKLVNSLKTPGGNCTGTSDVLDLSAQVDMIQAMQANVKSIGVLYTTSEQNSITQLKNLKTVCEKRGITVEATGVQNASDIPAAATALAAKVDCINNFTDNNVVENLTVVLDAANAKKIPVYGSEEEQVKNGCLSSMSIDYVSLGSVTGEMAAKILGGASAADMAVRTISDATPVINTDVATSLGITIPSAYADAEKVTTNTTK